VLTILLLIIGVLIGALAPWAREGKWRSLSAPLGTPSAGAAQYYRDTALYGCGDRARRRLAVRSHAPTTLKQRSAPQHRQLTPIGDDGRARDEAVWRGRRTAVSPPIEPQKTGWSVPDLRGIALATISDPLLMDGLLGREPYLERRVLEQMACADGCPARSRTEENQMRTFLYISAVFSITMLIVYLLLGPGNGLPSYAVFVS
jgi:hypothetical protein